MTPEQVQQIIDKLVERLGPAGQQQIMQSVK